MTETAFWSWAYRVIKRKHNYLPGRFAAKLLRVAVSLVLRFKKEPIIELRVGDHSLLVPWSHYLPMVRPDCPLSEPEIGRLAAHLSKTEGELLMIDVGANVGDTIAALPALDRAKFLCIEGSEKYHEFLRKNHGSDARVKPVFALLDDGSHQNDGVRLQEINGSAHLVTSEVPSTGAPVLTLDVLLERNSNFRNANFLKIDVDGYDLLVLRGATEFLRRAKPCLHIELAPTAWRDYGGCGLSDGLAFLSDFGYKEVLVYDNLGDFVGRDRTDSPAFLGVLWDYAIRNPKQMSLNLIAFHASRKDVEQFYSSERGKLGSPLNQQQK